MLMKIGKDLLMSTQDDVLQGILEDLRNLENESDIVEALFAKETLAPINRASKPANNNRIATLQMVSSAVSTQNQYFPDLWFFIFRNRNQINPQITALGVEEYPGCPARRVSV